MSTTTPTWPPTAAGPIDPVGADLTHILRSLKLSGMKDTLPERLALARQQQMGHAAFLELLLSDEVTRRASRSATLRAAKAGLDPAMRIETWNEEADLSYDRQLLSDLTSLRFAEAGNGVLILSPVGVGVGVGRTQLATALGHTAIRRRMTLAFYRADKLFTRLRAARLDDILEAEIQRVTAVDLLIVDDFALRPLDPTQTNDFYEILVERHRRASTIWVSNREPVEWLGMTTDALLVQSAVDRFTSGTHTLIVEGLSYRQRGAASPLTPRRSPACSITPPGGPILVATQWSHTRGNTVVPYSWQHSAPILVATQWSHTRGNTVVPSRWQATIVKGQRFLARRRT